MIAYDPDIERAVLLYNVISGPIFFAFALGVFLLMWFDKDRRNVVYRRLIMGLQLAAMGADQMLSVGAIVFLPEDWALYSVGLTFNIGIVIWIMLILFFISQILVCWFACLLYCHQQVVPPGSRFRLRQGTPKYFVLGFELAELVVGVFAAKMFKEMLVLDERIPDDLVWIKSKQSYGLFQYNDSFISYGIVITLITPPLCASNGIIFAQIFYFLRTEKRYISERTRRAQKNAAVTMILLAAVPAIFLIIPFYGSCVNIVAQKLFQGHLGFFDSPQVSAALFALANTHSIANSLTIVLRSTKYRRAVGLPLKMLCGGRSHEHRPSVIRVEDMTSHVMTPYQNTRKGLFCYIH